MVASGGVLQADAYAGFNELYRDGYIKKAACRGHVRRKIHDVHVRTSSEATTEALRRNGWAEADNNIAENALRTVSLGRKIICSSGQTTEVIVMRSCTG